jgi:hypothetical protein
MVRPTATTPREGGPATRPSSFSATDVDTTDWPAQAADTIERVVQNVRDKTTGPAINAARWFVAGLFLLIAGTAALILLIVMLVRLLNLYLPDSVFGEDHMWAAYGILGIVFSAVGLVLLQKRHPAPVDA